MTDLASLPIGTTIALPKGDGFTMTLDRVDAEHWAETSYHCIDCAEDMTTTDLQALADQQALAGGTPFEVLSVPASWLRDELTSLLDSLDDHVTGEDVADALRTLAIDAGLS